MLNGLLKKENIQIVDHADNWQQAIMISTSTLIKNGYVSEAYPQAIIQKTLEFGPYYVLAKDIAIPHASFEDGVIQQQIALVIFRAPVSFSEKSYDVRLLFTLAAQDKVSHLKALQELAEVFQNDALIDKLIHVQTVDEAVLLLSSEGGKTKED